VKLENILDLVEQLNDDDVIFAKKPWTFDSEAEVGQLDSSFKGPEEFESRGLVYFLEATLIREVLEVFGDYKPTLTERRALLMYYAEYDAYPHWVYMT
jgi:hypothetical protein